MPRYFFQIHDKKRIRDQEGIVLKTDDEARIEAVALLGEILKESPSAVASNKDWHMTVENDSGMIIFQLCLDLKHFKLPGYLS